MFKDMTDQQITNWLNWCARHDWGRAARYLRSTGKIHGLYCSEQNKIVSFDNLKDLRDFAGY